MRAGILALAVASMPAAASVPTVEVAFVPAEVTVGDHVVATLAVATTPGELAAAPRFPAWQKSWGEAEIVRAEPPFEARSRDGGSRWQQRLVLRAFRPGTLRLPRVEVALPGAHETVRAGTREGLALTIRSVLPPQAQAARTPPKPAEPLRQLPVGAAFWWTFGTLSALCLLAGRAAFRRPRPGAAAPAASPLLAPFDELAAELARLAAVPPGEAHTRLSWALRRYLGRVLPFAAVHSTTAQIQLQLLSRRLPGPLVRRTVELLRACDLVKFARAEASGDQTAERIAAAREIGRDFEVHFTKAALLKEAA